MVNYILVGCQRSGTTATHMLLRGHPNIDAIKGEVQLNNIFNEHLLFFNMEMEEFQLKNSISSIMNTLCAVNANEHTLAAGMKFALSNGTDAEYFQKTVSSYLPDTKIIYTKRGNLLDQYGSLLRARMTNQWHSWYNADKESDQELKINKQDLEIYLYKTIRCNQQIEKLQHTNDFIQFDYKDLDKQNFNGLFDFLKVPIKNPTWFENKKVSPPATQYIDQYDEWLTYTHYLENNFEELEIIITNRVKKLENGWYRRTDQYITKIKNRIDQKLRLLHEKM